MYGYFFYIRFTKGSFAPMKICIYYQLKPVIYCSTIYCETYTYFTLSFFHNCRSKNWPKSVVKETFVNQFLQGLFRNVENSPECLNNRIFKKSLKQEKCHKKLPNELRVIRRTCKIVVANEVFVLTIEFVVTNITILWNVRHFF